MTLSISNANILRYALARRRVAMIVVTATAKSHGVINLNIYSLRPIEFRVPIYIYNIILLYMYTIKTDCTPFCIHQREWE